MPAEEWPVDLPNPEIPSYQESRQNARRSSAAQNGPPRYTRRFSAVSDVLGLSLALDKEQLGIFEHFYRETLTEGTRPFYMYDPVRDGCPMLTEGGDVITDENDVPILVTVRRLCLWGEEPPQITIQAPQFFRAAFSVVYLP